MTSYREYYRSATIYAAAFDDSDKIELQFLNSSGRVEVTTQMCIRDSLSTETVKKPVENLGIS